MCIYAWTPSHTPLHSTSHHQPNKVERIEFTPGRGNLIVKYPGSTDKCMAFVGSHLDVVRVLSERLNVFSWIEACGWFVSDCRNICLVHRSGCLVRFHDNGLSWCVSDCL